MYKKVSVKDTITKQLVSFCTEGICKEICMLTCQNLLCNVQVFAMTPRPKLQKIHLPVGIHGLSVSMLHGKSPGEIIQSPPHQRFSVVENTTVLLGLQAHSSQQYQTSVWQSKD